MTCVFFQIFQQCLKMYILALMIHVFIKIFQQFLSRFFNNVGKRTYCNMRLYPDFSTMSENVHTVIGVFIQIFHQLPIVIIHEHPKKGAVPVWVIAMDVAQHKDGTQRRSLLLT